MLYKILPNDQRSLARDPNVHTVKTLQGGKIFKEQNLILNYETFT
jgi:hypothetical protein